MKVWPLKFRDMDGGDVLFADDTGEFFRSDEAFLERYVSDRLSQSDNAFLSQAGHAYDDEAGLPFTSFAYRWSSRQAVQNNLSYVILIPTLRCNLSCSYCQVARAAETAKGYDWSEQTLADTLGFLDRIDVEEIKIEFQGGEPLLRVDLLERVRSFCRERFRKAQFVVCTNLQQLGSAEWAFLDAEDTFISTSIDGDVTTHNRQRTQDSDRASQFFGNLEEVVARFGSSRISALPTIDVDAPPRPLSSCRCV